jgi:alkylation response protein AidB-like acyl-CoA dehydrogenase
MPYTELNLELTEEHELLKEEIHKFAVEVLRPASLELDKMSPEDVIKEGSPYWECMAQMYKNNYHTVYVPDEYGGLGLDPLGIHIAFEQIAYGSVGFAVSLTVGVFSAFYAETLCEDYLIDKFVTPYVQCQDGRVMSCWAITEPAHGSDNLLTGTPFFRDPGFSQQVKAVKKGSNWVINGQKSAWVSNAPIASDAALFVNTDSSLGFAGGGICLIDLNQPGVSRGKPLDKMGQRELPQGELFFDDAICPEEFMIVDPESYEAMTELTLAHANAGMGAFFTGVAQAAYDIALAYSLERVQGGKLLCRHEWVQHKLADMFIRVETARAYSRSALVFNCCTTPPLVQYSIGAKIYSTDVAFQVASDAIQLHGGYGVSKDFPIEKLFRDARAGMIEDGSNDSLRLAAGGMIVREAQGL